MSNEPVSVEGGPLSERSTNVGAGSGPIYEPGRSVSESSAGPLSGDSVRGSATGTVISGPVSEFSSGAVTEHVPVSGGGSVETATVGSVKKDLASPLGQMTSEPVSDLRPLQEQLRAIQPLPRNAPPVDESTTEEPAADQPAAPDVTTQEIQAEPVSEPVQIAEPPETPVEVPEASAPAPVVEPPENEPPTEDSGEPVVEQPPEAAAPEPAGVAADSGAPVEEKADQARPPDGGATPQQPEVAAKP